MITLDALKLYGANTAEGMARCLNNESFYLKMVGMALADKNFDKLKEAMDAGDARAAFSAAHALKGSIGNVSLTPIYEPVCELTELLRGKDAPVPGAKALAEQIMAAREQALSL
jgi:HPt (histidine-containing phosphotransfer) domain-containing protein